MDRRVIGTFVCIVVAASSQLAAQDPAPTTQNLAQTAERVGRCFTPVATNGVYFEVLAESPTADLLRAPTSATRRVHLTSISRVQVPTSDDLELAEEQLNVGVRTHALPVHRIGLRTAPDSPLLTPVRLPDAAPPTSTRKHAHHTAFDVPAHATAVDVALEIPTGTTGCRLRFR